jgi:S-DNA-T family DNA segregation ATPase FtsK/SpoIIIE
LFIKVLTCFFFVCSFVFLSGIYLIVGISIKKLKGIWFWDLFALVVISVLFGFATSLPELGGVVGYELNLFLQDYLGKQELYWY